MYQNFNWNFPMVILYWHYVLYFLQIKPKRKHTSTKLKWFQTILLIKFTQNCFNNTLHIKLINTIWTNQVYWLTHETSNFNRLLGEDSQRFIKNNDYTVCGCLVQLPYKPYLATWKPKNFFVKRLNCYKKFSVKALENGKKIINMSVIGNSVT